MNNNRLSKFVNKSFVLVLCVIALIFILLNMLFPLTVNIPYSSKIMSREGELLQAFLSEDDKWRMKCEPGSYPDNLKNAFIYKEDRWFYYHPGINPFAVARALFNNTVKGYRTSGASTITMQVARLLKPGKRTVLNKIHEAFIALQLEMLYSKEEILSFYFELIPYGSNIEGIHAASYIYFGKEAGLLSDAESTLLTIIPNKPTSLRPGRNDELILTQRNKWLKKFNAAGLITEIQLEDALNEPVLIRRQPILNTAPHLTNAVHASNKKLPSVKTTIAAAIQEAAQQVTFNHHLRLRLRNIYNASVVIVDNKNREVLAYIGNADFSDSEHSGQVNGIHALRSPGSALKPLVYGIAMDKGIITPKSVLPDVPVNYNGYSPENYNRDYQGEVTAEDALSMSLNIPAVDLLQEAGLSGFISALKLSSFKSIRDSEKKLGLSAVLGGCGVSLYELAGLYSAFANKGEYADLKYILNEEAGTSKRIISPEAAFMITQTLSKAQRPDLPDQFESNYNLPPIAWKTGTSYGRRDAWSIGYNDKYTIAVWCGNFDGTGIPELSGAEIATPLLFDLFSAIDRSGNRQWNKPPENIDIRYVCTSTGLPPGEYCTEKIIDQFIPAVSSSVKCRHMQLIAVNRTETVSYCTNCRKDGAKEKLYPALKPEVCSYYISRGIPFERIPEHDITCNRIYNDDAIAITSPLNNKEYLLEKGMDEKISLSCSPQSDASWLYWYINDKLYKKAKVNEAVFFKPDEGSTVVSCADDKGRSRSITIVVKYI